MDSYLFRGMPDTHTHEMVGTSRPGSAPSLPSTDEQTRAYWREHQQRCTPHLLSVWKGPRLVGSFLFEQLEGGGEPNVREYVIGGAVVDAPRVKRCVHIEVSDDGFVLQQLSYRPTCSREGRLQRGAQGSVPMVWGALAAVWQLEHEQDGPAASARLATLSLTDDSFLQEVKYPGSDAHIHRTISMADYMLVLHGHTWYEHHLGAQLSPTEGPDVAGAIQELRDRAAAPIPRDFDALWRSAFEAPVGADPHYGHPHRRRELNERLQELHAHLLQRHASVSWRTWLRAVRDDALAGAALLVVCWRAIMRSMHAYPVGTADWVAPMTDIPARLTQQDIRIQLSPIEVLMNAPQTGGAHARHESRHRELYLLLAAWARAVKQVRDKVRVRVQHSVVTRP